MQTMTVVSLGLLLVFAGHVHGARMSGQKQDPSAQKHQTSQEVEFQDIDGDWIQLVLEKGQINQYVNGELVRSGISRFDVYELSGTYIDDNGHGKFKPDQDLPMLASLIGALFRSEKIEEVKFQDTDGDWIRLAIEHGHINQYVNDELVHRGIARFEVDQDSRTYTDNDGQGNFGSDEDLLNLAQSVDAMFRTLQKNKVRFRDTDGDWIQLVLEKGQINQYVNDELVHRGLERFEIDQRTLTYIDKDGEGTFASDEDVPELERLIGILFERSKSDDGQPQAEAAQPQEAEAAQPQEADDEKVCEAKTPAKPPPRSKADSHDFYERLDIARDADEGAIKKAYRKAAKQWHPDKNPEDKEHAEKMFRNVAEAQDTLLDPEKRAEHDRELRQRESIHTTGFYHGECVGCSAYDNVFAHGDVFGARFGSRGHAFGGGYHRSGFAGSW